MNEEMRPPSEGQPTPEQAPRTSGMAIASLVLGILSFTCVTAPFAIILGIIALTQIRRNPNTRGAALAWAGIGISVVFFMLGLIFATILFPIFERARHTARQTSLRSDCMNNLRDLSMAVNMYADDYGTYPGRRWNEALRHYRPEDKSFSCPAVSGNVPSYGMNSRLAGLSPAQIVTPARTILLFDSVPGADQLGGPELLAQPPRHGGNNVSFADGHVEVDDDSFNWDPEVGISTPRPPEVEIEEPPSDVTPG